MKILIKAVAIILFVCSCGTVLDKNKHQDNNGNDSPSDKNKTSIKPNWQRGPQKDREAVQKAIEDTAQILKTCDGPENQRSPLCTPVDLEWDANDFMFNKSGPVVLVLESIPWHFIYGKYRHRTKGVLLSSSDGTYAKQSHLVNPKKAPKALVKLLQDDIADHPETGTILAMDTKNPAIISQIEVTILPNNPSNGHALVTTSIIGENSPETPFVFADDDVFALDQDVLCQKKWNQISERLQLGSSSLKQLIQELGITIINLSVGHDPSVLETMAKAECPDISFSDEEIKKLLELYLQFYEVLTNIPDVLVVQSGRNGFSTVEDATAERNPLDCSTERFPNRIRVGFYNATGNDGLLPAEGGSFEDVASLIPASIRRADHCYDVFVNAGPGDLTDGPSSFRVTWGIGAGAFPVMWTSFASPIITARMVNLVNESGPSDPVGLYNQLTSQGQFKAQDPLGNKQFDAFRLGYKP